MVREEALDFETDTERVTPQQAHDRWESVTGLQMSDLEGLRDTAEHEAYLDNNSGQAQGDDNPPIAGGPLDDAIHLAETPRSEWGADERAEAEEAINWASRHLAQFDEGDGEDLTPGDGTKTTKADVAAARWAFDFRPDDNWP